MEDQYRAPVQSSRVSPEDNVEWITHAALLQALQKSAQTTDVLAPAPMKPIRSSSEKLASSLSDSAACGG